MCLTAVASNKEINKKRFWRENIGLFLPIILVASWWIFYPDNKLSWFISILENKFDRSQGLSFTTKFLFYPREITFSYFFSPILALFLFIGFIWALKSWRSFKIRTLALLFLFNFLLVQIHLSNLQGRFIFTTMPAFFILGSFGLVKISSRVVKYLRKNSFLIGFSLPLLLVGSLSLLVNLIKLPGKIKPTATHMMCSPLFYQTDYYLGLPYDFWPSNWPRQYQEKEKIEDVMNFILKNIDYRRPVYLVGQLNELSPNLFSLYLEMARFTKPPIQEACCQEYWVTLEVKPNSIFNTEDYQMSNKFLEPEVWATKTNPQLRKITSKEFSSLGLEVTILAK